MPVARGGLLDLLEEEDDGEFVLTQEQSDAKDLWFSGVWPFCTGVWPLPRHAGSKTTPPRPICWTQDKMVGEWRPFPHYEYLKECILEPIFEAPRIAADGRPFKHRFAVPKPRQFFVTNGILIGCLWDVLKNKATEWLIAKNKQPEAERFIKERVRFTYDHLPAWFAGRSGKSPRAGFRTVPMIPAGRFRVLETLSALTPVARTFGESGEAIGETAKVLLDECIRIRNLGAVYDAADAQSPVIVMVSAPPERGAAVDPRSLATFREKFEGLAPGTLTRSILGRSDLKIEPDDIDDVAEVAV